MDDIEEVWAAFHTLGMDTLGAGERSQRRPCTGWNIHGETKMKPCSPCSCKNTNDCTSEVAYESANDSSRDTNQSIQEGQEDRLPDGDSTDSLARARLEQAFCLKDRLQTLAPLMQRGD